MLARGFTDQGTDQDQKMLMELQHGLLAITPRHHADLEQAALERAVEQRRLAARLEPSSLGRRRSAVKKKQFQPAQFFSVPSRVAGRKRRQLVKLADALAVGRVGDQMP
jgi:hypothetical protein